MNTFDAPTQSQGATAPAHMTGAIAMVIATLVVFGGSSAAHPIWHSAPDAPVSQLRLACTNTIGRLVAWPAILKPADNARSTIWTLAKGIPTDLSAADPSILSGTRALLRNPPELSCRPAAQARAGLVGLPPPGIAIL